MRQSYGQAASSSTDALPMAAITSAADFAASRSRRALDGHTAESAGRALEAHFATLLKKKEDAGP